MLRNVAVAGKSELEAHVIKATFPDHEIPKPKHVKAIFRYMNGNNNRCKEVAKMLLKRVQKTKTSKGNWQIIFKSLLVIHKAMQNREDDTFMRRISDVGASYLNLGSYLDRSSTSTWGHSKFCREYAQFLTDKLIAFKDFGRSLEHSSQDAKRKMKTLEPSELLRVCESLIQQLRDLVDSKPFEDENGFHPLMKYAMLLLSKDAYSLCTVMSLGVYCMMDHLVELEESETRSFLEITENYCTIIEDFSTLRKQIRVLKRSDVTELLMSPEDKEKTLKWLANVKECLQSHIDEDFGVGGTGKRGKKKRNQRKGPLPVRTRESDSIEGEVISLDAFLGEENNKSAGRPARGAARAQNKTHVSGKDSLDWGSEDEFDFGEYDSKLGKQKQTSNGEGVRGAEQDLFNLHFPSDGDGKNKKKQEKTCHAKPSQPQDDVMALFSLVNPSQGQNTGVSNPAPTGFNPFAQQMQQQQYQGHASMYHNPSFGQYPQQYQHQHQHQASGAPPSNLGPSGVNVDRGLTPPPSSARKRNPSAERKPRSRIGAQASPSSQSQPIRTATHTSSSSGGINFDELFA